MSDGSTGKEDLLILVPAGDDKEVFFQSLKWEKATGNSENNRGWKHELENKGSNPLVIFCLNNVTIAKKVKIGEKDQPVPGGLLEFLKTLKEQMEDLNLWSTVATVGQRNIIVLGHLHTPLETLQERLDEMRNDNNLDKENKKLLNEFRDPLYGNGDFLITSYSVGGKRDENLNGLLDKTKKDSDASPEYFVYRDIFDYLWLRAKFPPIAVGLIREVFMLLQSGGKGEGWQGVVLPFIRELGDEATKAFLPDLTPELKDRLLSKAEKSKQPEEQDLRDLFQALDKGLEKYSG